MAKGLTLILLCGMLGGCAAKAGNCAGWSPILPSKKDTLTSGTTTQILQHNQYGAKSGCWSGR